MPRRIDFAGTSEQCSRLLSRMERQPGVIRLTLQRGASVRPDGDVLVIDTTNQDSTEIVNILSDMNFLRSGAVTISEPNALVRDDEARAIDEEGNDAVWEEIGAMMRQDTNVTANYLMLMALAGAIAAFGLIADQLHIVIGAMLTAPGFEPLLRIVFGTVGRGQHAWAGLRSTAAGYLSLGAAAAIVAPLAMYLKGVSASELADLYWVQYWSRVEASGVVVSLFAGIAGGVIVSTRMKVLSTGVMVALALIPSMALVGMGLVTWNLDLVAGGIARWGVEVACVLIGGGLVIAVKRSRLHRRMSSA